jgi:uncharacterized protein (DUF983 family)
MNTFLRLLKASLKLSCPACSQGKLFKTIFKIVNECPNCKLSFQDSDLADGPAFIVISIMLFIFAPGLIMLEVKYEPPLIFHLLCSIPLLIIIAIYCYRIAKSFMISHAYYAGRLKPKDLQS